MKLLFFGDSITDMNRERETNERVHSYGDGFVFLVASNLQFKFPRKYEIVNRGISGNGIFDLYARIKGNVWKENPDVLTILIGINDIMRDLDDDKDCYRWGKIYRMMIEDTQKRLLNTKIILCEPFALKGSATDCLAKVGFFEKVNEYRAEVKRIAIEYGLSLVELQERFEELAIKYGEEEVLFDGIHPDTVGAMLIANEWLKTFDKMNGNKDVEFI